MPEVKLSDIKPGPEMAQAAMDRIRNDYDWRARWLGKGYSDGTSNFNTLGSDSLDRAAELFEAWTGENIRDPEIPRVNLIHKAVEDFLSVALTNIPKAQLKATRFIGTKVPEWERPIRLEVIHQTELVLNAYIRSILDDNNYNDLIQRAVTHAAIFGVGYMMTGVDTSLDERENYMIRDILNKEDNLTAEDLELLNMLTNRLFVKVIDPRDVYWRHSVRDVKDDSMLRVSIVEHMDTESLREIWGDSKFLSNPMNIKPGSFPYFIRKMDNNYLTMANNTDSTTAVVTMYELEPMSMERLVEDENGNELRFPYTGWMMHKVIIAGGELVDYESWDSSEGPLRLPIVPIYLRKSVNHPYGWSLPLMLEKSEEYINAVQTIMFRSALRAVSSQGVVVAIPNLGDADLAELEHVLEEGGVARITGNTSQGPINIREMVMPINYVNAPINPVLTQAMQIQMNMFSSQSQEVDAGAIGAARSGTQVRAQIAVADRPKTISINVMSEGIEEIHDNLYELIRTFYKDQIIVSVSIPGGGKEQVGLNEPYERDVVIMDPKSESPQNPLGLKIEKFSTTLNATNVTMNAKTDGRSDLPMDVVSRFQLGIALVQAGAIQPETLREFALSANEDLKNLDDMIVLQKKQEQLEQQYAALQQAQAMAQSQQIQQGGALGGTQIPADAYTSVAPQDIQASIDQDPSSIAASSSSPYAF
jgi:hypothetical protein